MQPYNESLQAMGDGDLTLEADGTYEILYLLDAYTPNQADGGHAFESDLGANISHRETLVNPTWLNRVFDADDLSIVDPDNGDTVTKIVVVKSANGTGGAGGGGSAATNRILCYQALAGGVSWDGTNDNQTFDAQGIFRVGPA